MPSDPPPEQPRSKVEDGAGHAILQKLPIAVILVVAVLGVFFLRDKISFAALADNRETLLAYRDAHYGLTLLTFLAAYILIVGFSLPGATICTLTGGFLFATFPGVVYNVAGASLGAIAIFLAARTGFGAGFAKKIDGKSGAIGKLKAGLKQDEWSYLFLMRFAPVVPFFLANLIPAFVGTSLLRFAVTTVLGILPGTLVLTSVGAGLGAVFADDEMPDLGIVFEPFVLGPLLGLAALSALPILIKRFRKHKDP